MTARKSDYSQRTPDYAAPLVVSPRVACAMLDVGPTKLWHLIEAGQLDSYLDGPRRRITTLSIRDYIARRLVATAGQKCVNLPRRNRDVEVA